MYPNLFRLPEWLPVLGGEPITSFGVMILLAFLAGAFIHRVEMRRVELDPDATWDLLFMAVLGGIVGAKLYYVGMNAPRLPEEGWNLIFSRGGLVWHGGFLGGLALVVWQARRMRLPFGRLMDSLALPVVAGYGVGRIGCFLVGDDYGRPTDSWVGIAFPQGAPPTRVDVLEGYFGITVDPELVARFGEVVPVHPTQLYEVGLAALTFGILWQLRDHERIYGWLFSLWLVLAGMSRFFIEFVRVKDDRYFGMLSLAQVMSLVLVTVGVGFLLHLGRRREREPAAP